MVLKTNVSHAHTIRKWPEDVDRALDVRAFLHANRKYRSHSNRALLPTLANIKTTKSKFQAFR